MSQPKVSDECNQETSKQTSNMEDKYFKFMDSQYAQKPNTPQVLAQQKTLVADKENKTPDSHFISGEKVKQIKK